MSMIAGSSLTFYQYSLDEPHYVHMTDGSPQRIFFRDGWQCMLPPDDKLFFSKMDGDSRWGFSRPYVEGMDLTQTEPLPPQPSLGKPPYLDWDLIGALRSTGTGLGVVLISASMLLLAGRFQRPEA